MIGAAAPRLPNTTALALPGVAAETQVIALDLDGVMVSAGAACSSGKVGPSHVLAAMGLPPDIAGCDDPGQPRLEHDRGRHRPFPRAWTALARRALRAAESARGMNDIVHRAALSAAAERANRRPIYLDNQSTTPLDPRVLEAMLPYFTEQFGNPHSESHVYGQDAAGGDRARRAARSPR